MSDSILSMIASSVNPRLESFSIKFSHANFLVSYISYEGIERIQEFIPKLKNFSIQGDGYNVETKAMNRVTIFPPLESAEFAASYCFSEDQLIALINSNPKLRIDLTSTGCGEKSIKHIFSFASKMNGNSFHLIMDERLYKNVISKTKIPSNVNISIRTFN